MDYGSIPAEKDDASRNEEEAESSGAEMLEEESQSSGALILVVACVCALVGIVAIPMLVFFNHQDNAKCTDLLPFDDIDILEYSLRSRVHFPGELWSLEDQSGEEIARFKQSIINIGIHYDIELQKDGEWIEPGWEMNQELLTLQHSKFTCKIGENATGWIQFGIWNHAASFFYSGKYFSSPQGQFGRQFQLTKDLSFTRSNSTDEEDGMSHLYIRQQHLTSRSNLKICIGRVNKTNEAKDSIVEDAVQGGTLAIAFVDTVRYEEQKKKEERKRQTTKTHRKRTSYKRKSHKKSHI